MNRKRLNQIMLLWLTITVGVSGKEIKHTSRHNLSIREVSRCFPVEEDSIPPDTSGMRDLSSIEIAREMVPGWNVGNSLEAIGGETAWGNPKITQQLMDSIKAAGFNAVRIPVAWSNFSDPSNFTIKREWLERVEEVVWYVLNNGMYAIINEHWDNGWIQPTYADSAYVKNRLAAMWKQIAIYFRDYDDHLLFAGTNEVHVEGYWGTPTKENYTVQNMYNQVFVNTIRSTGGRNYYRHILIQGYQTNIDFTLKYLVIPQDVVPQRLMIEVHYYDPYNFTLNEDDRIIQWGMYATNPARTETWANESYADNQFNKMKTNFSDKGYAVILGEYGAMARLNLGSSALNAEHAEYRRYYIYYITNSLVRHGLVPFYWDNGYLGDHGCGIFNRYNGSQAYPGIVKAIMDGVKDAVTGTDQEAHIRKPSALTLYPNYPNPFNARTAITYTLPARGAVFLKIYDLQGQVVATLENGITKNPGHYQVSLDASRLTSGIYFCRLKVGDQSRTIRMLLLK